MMLNEVYLLAIPMTYCCLGLQKKRQIKLSIAGVHAGLQYLKRAEDIFVKWKATGTTGLTNATFTACI